MKESEMRTIGKWLAEVLAHPTDATVLGRSRAEVVALGQQFPAPSV
jgi:glycine/serine hydroxymethyltransferase